MLRDKRIVITGGSRGLGRAIAIACAREGAAVGVGYRRDERMAAEVVAEIEAMGGAAMALGFDVVDAVAVENAIAEFCNVHAHVDGWVNNAGVVRPSLLVTSELEDLSLQLNANLLGPILCSRAILPRMMRRRSGVLLNISSVAAVRPVRGQSVYAASKGGLEAFTRAIALEYARKGIRALCVRPGAIDTEMLEATRTLADQEVLARIPQGRVASTDEVAAYVVFLLSDAARYVTGTCATIDGGYVL